MQKVQAEMSTQIALDTLKAETSLKSLNAVIVSTKNGWKSQEVALKSTGQYLKAAETRYKGLGDSIKAQESKIESLRDKQKGLDVTTKDGAASYLKYQKDIDAATTQLKSLEAQQARAKRALDLQKTGIIDLNKSIENSAKVSNSYISVLKAEGKAHEANIEKYRSMRSAYTQQAVLYQKEVDYLKKIEAESGKTSDDYAKQAVKVNELGAKMATAKTEMLKMATSSNVTSRAFSKVQDAGAKAGSVIRAGWEKAKGAITAVGMGVGAAGMDLIAGAKQASALQKVYVETNNLLVSGGEKQAEVTKNVNKMQEDGANLSMKYGKSQKAIAEAYEDLVKRGYTSSQALGVMETELQGSVASGDEFSDVVTVASTTLEGFGLRAKTTAQMTANTKQVVNALAYAADMTASGFSDMGLAMSYVSATAKSLHMDVSQTASAIGILSNNGVEADKAGTGLRKVLNSLADPASKTMKLIGLNSKSFRDAHGNLLPLTDSMKLLYEHTKNLSTGDKAVVFKSLFGTTGMQAGQILAEQYKSLDQVTKATEKAAKSGTYVQKIADKNNGSAQQSLARFKQSYANLQIMLSSKLLPVLSDAADALSKGLANKSNQKMIKQLAVYISDAAKGVLNFAKYCVDHKDDVKKFAEVVAGIWVVGKVSKFIGVVGQAIGLLSKLGAAKKAASAVSASLDTSSLITGSGLRNAVKQFGATKLGKITATVAIAYDVISDIKDVTKAFGKGGTVHQKFEAVGETAGTAVGGGIGFAIAGPAGAAVGATIGKTAGKWGGDAAEKMTKGWNAKKRPASDWLAQIGFDAHKGATGIAKWWKGIQTQNGKDNAKMEKQQAAANKKMKKDWDSFWGHVSDKTKTTWSGIKGHVSDGFNTLKTNSKSGMATVKSHISDAWDGIRSKTSSAWSGIKKHAGNGIDWVASHVKGGWSGLGGVVGDIFGGVKNAILHPIQTAKSLLAGLVDGIKGLFNFRISLPHIPMPHFNISGSMNPLDWIEHHTLPHISVDWKANGGLINTPTLLSAAGNRLTIGGEAGPEMVVPLSASKASRAWQLLGQAVQQINASQASAQTQLPAQADNSDVIAAINALGVLLTKLSFNVQIGDDQFYPKVAPKVKAYNDRQNSFRTAWQD
ncbi:phage tail tape measure protein [Lacticaseibacillus mingshuiensis]|uniref:Phage tail tape measure protein n=1 Tax=Lacticaseibacillus mingshuiensis TaxID=2799574 RepID=A0ABW4CFI0_9LACO|nr:phage tail tape measure protein [Lacticaseibacillus mingshuiensis]